ncbi:MAG: sigma-70 family RNA polymerase sigma factor [Isosphaerales bacterium]
MRRDVSGTSRLYLKALFEEGVPAGLTDGQLLERFVSSRGEAAELAFAILVERHGPMVLRACRGILRDDHEAMDAFQATFLVLIKKGRSLWVRDSLGPWLHRVACRAAGRARAEAGRRRALEKRLAKATLGQAGGRDRDDLAAAVHEELDRLPDRYRVPIVLCDLEGRTCEEAARQLGCPIGTIGSRLARGRERLRGRLARRGLAPAVGTLVAMLSTESKGAGMPAALAKSTTQLALGRAAGDIGAGAFSAGSAKLAEHISRSLLMIKLMSVGAASVAAVGVCLTAGWSLRPGVGAQVPPVAVQVAPESKPVRAPLDEFPFMNDKERHKDFLYAEIGNMRPLIKNARGVRFQSREAIRYKDGTAKLWSLERKDPIAPTLRHKGPIRELTFFDESNLLITLSDESVKVWDALTGKPRKELKRQTIGPMWLSFAPNAQRFVTFDSEHRVVTVWDAVTLAAVATLRAAGGDHVVEAAGLSADGKTVVMFRFRPDPSAELWDVASGQTFGTLRLPSSAVAEVFAEGGKSLNKDKLQKFKSQRDTRFWEVVRSLAPTAGERKS